jgi:hypothetical protein
MGDKIMTETLLSGVLKTPSPGTPDKVVKSLDESSWFKADIENKLRAKLNEYAKELQTVQSLLEER